MDVETNFKNILQKVEKACEKSNRYLKDIKIIGVTKYVTIERTREAEQAGITHLGENRDDEFLRKYDQLNSDIINWHFIGSLQTRKVKDVVNKVSAIHSLDRMSLAKEINKRADTPIDCFIQVNVSGEETKHGLNPEDVLSFVEEIGKYEKIRVVGLMTMAPHIEDENIIRSTFQNLASLRDKLKAKGFKHAPANFLSMGMSNDYQIAIEEGATHIRIGSELVGPYKK